MPYEERVTFCVKWRIIGTAARQCVRLSTQSLVRGSRLQRQDCRADKMRAAMADLAGEPMTALCACATVRAHKQVPRLLGVAGAAEVVGEVFFSCFAAEWAGGCVGGWRRHREGDAKGCGGTTLSGASGGEGGSLLEVVLHCNDERLVVGIPLTAQPMSLRPYLRRPGIRCSMAWAVGKLANIQPGDLVLDSMCGSGTVACVPPRQGFSPLAPLPFSPSCLRVCLCSCCRWMTVLSTVRS